MGEIWKEVIGYEGLYQVSDHGRVRSVRRGIVLKPGAGGGRRNSYLFVVLCVNNVRNNQLVHRLVAKAFLGVHDLEVNHIDEDPHNNAASNLEWCTRQENVDHSKKKYAFISPLTGLKVVVNDLKKFCKDNELRCNHMCSVSSGARKSHKGWRVFPSVNV